MNLHNSDSHSLDAATSAASTRERSDRLPENKRSAFSPTRSVATSASGEAAPKDRAPRVTLVGAGPGDPDLITRKGLKALQTADVVLYDALSSDELLEETPAHCLRVFVGKRAGCHYKKQEEINEMLVAAALEYGHAVRLKGGDPFIFGRGQEEKAYAEAAGIPVTVVPGISSCISLPELQGVAPTSRGYADSFWVLTAHTRSGGLSEDLLLAPKSNATVIILMGLGRLDQICALWDAEGKGSLPAMVIQNGSRPNERAWVGTVNDIAERVTTEKDKGPGIIVLGETVSQHPDFKVNALAAASHAR
ncbi:uroporphyrinogen-III C-methyltransferase [Neolewinella agarilytica]|uniref:uroporphyrinogen-III C-methyltransferase n=1 Tax=Neolewinella agarilytica TaxID=478744 RepID=A0A1H9E1D6_9BACT|nr:uroporphyrinogen-III C-methyltransferase [Neolewinella agarilytica]SEQ19546.1 uroporphyrinogen-III C-methyltransferase [Neolewinella agarilytica]